MADTYESYEVYIDATRSDEFQKLIEDRFGQAIELNWLDTFDTDASYEAYVDSDRDEEFRALLSEQFADAFELNWRDTLSI